MVEAQLVGIARATGRFGRAAVALGGFAILIWATTGHADDAKKAAEKAKAERILVQAFYSVGNGRDAERRAIALFSVDPVTGESRRVGEPDLRGGTLSPDGRHLIKSHGRPGTPTEGLWVHDLTGESQPRKVFDRFGIPSWIDHGDQIIIGHPLGPERYQTYRMQADGSGLTLLPIPETDLVESCSEDGSWLASWEQTGGRTRINVMRPDGTARHAVVDEPTMLRGDFHLSPDGKKLAYLKISLEDTKARFDLWIAETEGKDRKQVPVAFDPGTTVRFRWSPDGARFAFGLTDQGGVKSKADLTDDRIVVADVNGQNMRTLPLPPMPESDHPRLLLLGWE